MDKAAIQGFASWARKDLIEQVSQRAFEYGITKDSYVEADAVSIQGRILNPEEQRQRSELIEQIRQKGYEQVIEEVAYTWFNRFIALRFMEVNNYLPSHIRVFSDSTGIFNPEILKKALQIKLPGLNQDKVADYIEQNRTEDLYRYLLLIQCNALNEALPRMFEYMGGYTELLLPNNILKPDGVPARMVQDIPEGDWNDQVQIIGWLYQYYNTELKDDTYALLKKNVKITKERIPSATQLFTPDWIVRYMVENSLGRLWIEGHPNDELKANWEYYLDEAEQEADVQAQLEAIRTEYRNLKPQDIKVIDPCMGSGHILVYAFDVLVQIYKTYGIIERDAAQSILENNLYGLDIDDRAAQLAYFAVMMKARQYDRRVFSRGIQPYVYSIVESNELDASTIEYFTNNDPKLKKDFGTLVEELHDAKEYGSILKISQVDFAALYTRVDEVRDDISLFRQIVLNTIFPLIQIAEILSQKYSVAVTNPPYMSISAVAPKLNSYIVKNYPDSKADLFSVFIERCRDMLVINGYQAMITMHAWMFLKSFEKIRHKILAQDTVSMAHLGARAFEEIGGEVVQTTAFVMRKSYIENVKGTYCRLVEPSTQDGKENLFLDKSTQFCASRIDFEKIPGSPIAYWVSPQVMSLYETTKLLGSVVETKQGLKSSDDKRFFRYWVEVNFSKIDYTIRNKEDAKRSTLKWVPLNKGGSLKWFGENWYVVNWENDGKEIKEYAKSLYKSVTRTITSIDYYFRRCLTWPQITSAPRFRAINDGFIFNAAGPSMRV